MLYRVTASIMILIMGIPTIAPAQIYSTRAARNTSRTQTSLAQPAETDSTITKTPETPPRVGLDAPIDPATYVVGPGDKFILFVRPQAMEIPLTVLPEGRVLVPNAGLVQAAGLTIDQFREELARTLSSFYRGSEFYCQLVTPRTFIAYVLGDVQSPGAVQMVAPFRVTAAIEAVGGVTGRGTERKIEIREGDRVVSAVDLVKFQRLGDASDNPMLHEGQTVYVPARGPICSVTGEVWHGGTLEYLEGETAADLVALSGGFTTNANRQDLVLERVDANGAVTIRHLGEPDLATTLVQDQDVVVVPDRRSFPGIDFVRVQGGGGRDGRIYLGPGETLDSFRPRFIRLRNDYDLANSRIERKKENGTIEFIPVDLSRLVEGDTTLAFPLKAGDVINIPSLDDIVFVTGNVVAPGKVDFQRGLPVGRYVAMAGGPNDEGSVDKIEIYDNKGNRREGDRDSVVFRGETILVKRRTSAILGSFFIGFVSLTSLMLSVYAVTK
jgi:protein involved in polysaccharide export with SLBB domain